MVLAAVTVPAALLKTRTLWDGVVASKPVPTIVMVVAVSGRFAVFRVTVGDAAAATTTVRPWKSLPSAPKPVRLAAR